MKYSVLYVVMVATAPIKCMSLPFVSLTNNAPMCSSPLRSNTSKSSASTPYFYLVVVPW